MTSFEGQHFEGQLNGGGMRFGVVVSRFNSMITERLLEGAVDCLVRHGVAKDEIDVARAPGSWELPLALEWMASGSSGRKYDALLAIGCVIRGGTPHFDYVAGEVTKGSFAVQMNHRMPVALGVLTTDTIEQAVERAGTKMGNKGWEAAMAALEMVSLRRSMG